MRGKNTFQTTDSVVNVSNPTEWYNYVSISSEPGEATLSWSAWKSRANELGVQVALFLTGITQGRGFRNVPSRSQLGWRGGSVEGSE